MMAEPLDNLFDDLPVGDAVVDERMSPPHPSSRREDVEESVYGLC